MYEDIFGDDMGKVLDMIDEADEVEELDPDDPDYEELKEQCDGDCSNCGC